MTDSFFSENDSQKKLLISGQKIVTFVIFLVQAHSFKLSRMASRFGCIFTYEELPPMFMFDIKSYHVQFKGLYLT